MRWCDHSPGGQKIYSRPCDISAVLRVNRLSTIRSCLASTMRGAIIWRNSGPTSSALATRLWWWTAFSGTSVAMSCSIESSRRGAGTERHASVHAETGLEPANRLPVLALDRSKEA